jgi:tetratricopeptide (TPR) repeat protein
MQNSWLPFRKRHMTRRIAGRGFMVTDPMIRLLRQEDSRNTMRLSRFLCQSKAAMLPALLPLACLFLILPVSYRANAQTGTAGMQMKAIPAPEDLPPPLTMSGIGNSHLAITATPEAQAWFDQGLNLLHDFWDYESARAFEQGIRVDPNCAMCYWGLYQALMSRGDGPTAYSEKAIAGAVRLKDHANKEEKLYIEAAVAGNDTIKAGPGGHPDNTKEVGILRQLVKKYPKDSQAKLFLAESIRDGYDDAGKPKKGTQGTIGLLEEVLKTNPNDSAANHYWIHAMEGDHPERALESAQRLASLAPASGHMVHMPGHIFYRVGDYAQAESWFAESTAVDEKYMRDQHVDSDDDWNYIHNLMYAVANLMEEGKLQEAMALSNKFSAGRGELAATLYIHSPRDGMARLNNQLPVALRTGDWAAVLKMIDASKPDAKLENLNFLAGQLKDFASGMQAAETGNLAKAKDASDRLDAGLWRKSQQVKDEAKKTAAANAPGPVMAAVMPDAMAGPLVSNLSVMSLELRATILAGEKRLPEAKVLFTQAAKDEKYLGYREPPIFIRPVGETEGFALLRAGDYAGAHEAFAAALLERPNSGFGLYGEAQSSEKSGNTAQTAAEYAKFAEAWKNADADLPEVQHARQYLAQHRVSNEQTEANR